MIRRLVAMSAMMAMATAIAACGLPEEDEFQPIDRSQDGFDLWETSTTSTTLPPTSTNDGTSSTIAATTSTIAQTELVEIFFPTGQQLTSIPIALPSNPALPQVIARMLEGPPPELAAGIRPILPADADIKVAKSRGVVTVDFPSDLFDDMESPDQRLVFGQIVLTLAGQPGVGQVLFTLADAPMRVYLGDGNVTEPGDTVVEEDYAMLTDSGQPIATTTTVAPTTTTTTTTTTVAAGVDPTARVDGLRG